MNYLEVENLSFRYDSEPVLQDINLSVESGEFIMLTGENGAAKTTLLRNVLGVIEPETGLVHRAEKNIKDEKLVIGYIPQNASNFNPGFPSTVEEFVRSGRYPQGKWFKRLTQEDLELVESVLEEVGMWGYRKSRIGDLSGGQKQRISIARVLAMDPDFYILDEPTTGMDKESREKLYKLLKNETKNNEKSVLMVTHEQDELIYYADRHMRLVRKEDTPWRCFSLIS